MKLFYTILLYLIQPLVLFRLLLRSFKIPAYRKCWGERYGFYKRKITKYKNGILLHTVSVGETIAVIPLISLLRNNYPYLPITITTITNTGYTLIKSKFCNEVNCVFLPYDLPCAMNRFIKYFNPKLVIIMETELWPNMISAFFYKKIPIIIANARLSEKSANGYKKLGKFMHRLLSKITLIAAQNEEYGARFISLGLNKNQLIITGNLKFDISITPELTANAIKLRNKLAPRRNVWIATSTHNGEEKIILKAHRKLLEKFPDLLLILVPRHPERFKKTRSIVYKKGFTFMLRSTKDIIYNYDMYSNYQVIIGDTIGELMLLYGIADLAFVGGSLVKCGGHNPLEPAAHSIPIIMGPYTFNFKDICTKLQQANGLITVTDVTSIIEEVSKLLTNEKYRIWYGRNAINFLHNNQGGLLQLLNNIQPYLTINS